MQELTPHQKRAIELLEIQLRAMLDLYNHMNPDYTMTFEEALNKLPTSKKVKS